MDTLRVSVIIPVYNGARFISEAIDSVLAQTYPVAEIIVVDDGSTDTTREVLDTYAEKITLIALPHTGQSAARNAGLRKAQGAIIGMLDADDLWPVNHIELLIPFLQESSSYGYARGLTQYFRNTPDGQREYTKNLFMEALVGACLYTQSTLTTVGFFDESMSQGEDLDWHIRITEHGIQEKRIEQTTLLYRRHDTNLTNNPAFVQNGQIDAFRKKIARSKMKS